MLYREAIEHSLIYRMAGSDWLESQTGVKASHVRKLLHRLEDLGWLKIIPLAEMKTKHHMTWEYAKDIQARNRGGRAPTLVELRSDPNTPTAWIRSQQAA